MQHWLFLLMTVLLSIILHSVVFGGVFTAKWVFYHIWNLQRLKNPFNGTLHIRAHGGIFLQFLTFSATIAIYLIIGLIFGACLLALFSIFLFFGFGFGFGIACLSIAYSIHFAILSSKKRAKKAVMMLIFASNLHQNCIEWCKNDVDLMLFMRDACL